MRRTLEAWTMVGLVVTGVVGLFLMTGCGARPAERETSPTSQATLEMDPVVVASRRRADGSLTTRMYDARMLFEKGQTAFEAGNFSGCDTAYAEVVSRFPESRYHHSALYNRGLCAEALKEHLMAAQLFGEHARLAKVLADKRDGQIRMGFNLVEGAQYEEALRLYALLLKAPDLGHLDRAECLLRKGIVLARQKNRAQAENAIRESMESVRLGTNGLVIENDLFAEAHFRRAEIYQALCQEVALRLPLESMKDDLADKVRFFRQAQHSFLDALNVRERYWATAAGLKLGELYEKFYDDLVAAQVPEDFDEQTRELYFQELREQIQPLLEQSVSIYERNMSMSMRLGAENEWVEETRRRLSRLREIIEDNAQADKDDPEGEPAAPASEKPKEPEG